MTTETKTPKPGEWIATITGICAIHGIEETWGTYGDTSDEARSKLNIHALEAEGHELTDWEAPTVGRVFELPKALAEPTPTPMPSPGMRTPSEIADTLGGIRPDLTIGYHDTGDGQMTIVAERPEDDSDASVLFGVAAGHLGWSNPSGDHYGDWPRYDVHDAWQENTPIHGATARAIVIKLAAVLEGELPTGTIPDLCMACAQPIAIGYESPNNDDANGVRFCESCTGIEDEMIAEAEAEVADYHPLGGKQAEAVNSAARANIDMELRRVGDQLRNHASALAFDMTRLLDDLATGRRINELGIVQGNGSAVDRLCAQRHTLIEIKRTLEGSK